MHAEHAEVIAAVKTQHAQDLQTSQTAASAEQTLIRETLASRLAAGTETSEITVQHLERERGMLEIHHQSALENAVNVASHRLRETEQLHEVEKEGLWGQVQTAREQGLSQYTSDLLIY